MRLSPHALTGLMHSIAHTSLACRLDTLRRSQSTANVFPKSPRIYPQKTINQFQSHATESERLLASLSSDKELLETIRHHHEKYNGEGYPDQLQGNNIPLSARILAVADLYDSLLVGKLYGGQRITPADAIEQMTKSNNGISLDPTIVNALIKLLDKNPVLLQPKENNALGVYTLIFLQPGVLMEGDLIIFYFSIIITLLCFVRL